MMLLLAACGNEDGDSGIQDDGTPESTGEEAQSDGEDGGSMEASDIIGEASSAWGDTVSYEARQTSTISSGDSQYVVRTITTRSEQNEIKVEVDDGEEIKTHYIFEGDHFIYQGGTIEAQDTPREIEDSRYGDLVSRLEPLREGTASEQESGYEVRYTIDEKEDAVPFFNEEMTSALENVDTFNGLVTVQFNEEYQYTGAKLTLTVGSGEEEMNIISNITMDRIGQVEMIEKPKEM
ncbi:hypothetical protein [Salinicoccus bachuensis]|uniref:Lipoprotein n=1 Tax=Salinicoccus bachuensis TaxID=3136731 RepID=A0ABZ3CFC3_9STAP